MKDDAAGRIEDTLLSDALSERYLAYALSTIMARSLPDVRDGLKPVHRRLIYAMQQLRLDPAAAFTKCARVVGDVMGKFHPHGDAAIYEAMVRLAQEFAQRYPLVEGQGNFGNVDGDNPASMRYTEARLTRVAQALLDGIDEDTVEFRPNYDGRDSEPVVLPGAFPNLLANGATGIAVGMATSIPPHNAGELCAAALHLIEDPAASTAALLAHVRGPDFPTGGVLVEDPATIAAAYETGRGGFRVRARWAQEKLPGGGWRIVVTEIPYQVAKARLVEQIAALLLERKLPLLGDVRDESDAAVRLILEPRTRTVDPALLMESLFRSTPLETRFPLNINVLDASRTPRVMGVREVLRAWLDHRHTVLVRRTAHRAAAIARRLEVLEGYLAVYLDLDTVLRLIRDSDEPKPALMATFHLTDIQAEAILNMRLRSLRRLEELEIRREHVSLSEEQAELAALRDSERLRWTRISAEITATAKAFGGGPFGARRTAIAPAPAPLALRAEAFVEREPITVLLSAKGWLRAIRGHGLDLGQVKFKEGDAAGLMLACSTTDRLCLFGSNGRAYGLRADAVPRGRGDGQGVRLLIDLGQEETIVALLVPETERRYVVASSAGRGFVVPSAALLTDRRAGRQVLVIKPGERTGAIVPADGDHVAVSGAGGKLLIFPLDRLPEMTRGGGVLLQRNRGLVDLRVFRLADGLSWRWGERTRTETDLRLWLGERGQAGHPPPNGFPRDRRFG